MSENKQIDFFFESIVDAPVKDDQELMMRPYFSLSKTPRMEPIVYQDEKYGVSLRIDPGPKGIATIWDKDLLIYLASLITDRVERGLPVDRKVRFPVYDFLRATNRGSGKQAYELFKDMVFRLRSTTVTTNVRAAGAEEVRGFGWIDNFRIHKTVTKTGREIMAACEISLNDWMFRAIVDDKRVLTISRGYFTLSRGLERRLYELARKHCGYQTEWKIGLPKLSERCGSLMELKEFKRQLKKIVLDDPLPGYHISLAFDPGDANLQELTQDGFDTRRWVNNERIIVVFSRRQDLLISPES